MNEFHLQNIAVVARFEKYEKENKKPVIAVWCGKRLVIISHKQDNFLRKITQLFTQIFYAFLRLLGLLKIDEAKAQELKEKVYHFHLEQAQKYKLAELKKFEREELLKVDENIKEAKDNLKGYFEKICNLQAMIEELENDSIESVEGLNQIENALKELEKNNSNYH